MTITLCARCAHFAYIVKFLQVSHNSTIQCHMADYMKASVGYLQQI